MKRLTAIALLAFASLLFAGVAMAADRGAQANIPFAFNVGDTLFPAGDYTISQAGWRPSGVIEIRSADAKYATLTTAFGDAAKPVNGGELVFNRYGDRYFLTEVLCPNGGLNMQLPTSKLEQRVRINEAALPTTTQILVATK